METPTDRQRQVLNLVETFRARKGRTPSYSEIARELGVSRTAIAMHLAALLRKGLLVKVQVGTTESGRARRVLSRP